MREKRKPQLPCGFCGFVDVIESSAPERFSVMGDEHVISTALAAVYVESSGAAVSLCAFYVLSVLLSSNYAEVFRVYAKGVPAAMI